MLESECVGMIGQLVMIDGCVQLPVPFFFICEDQLFLRYLHFIHEITPHLSC
jgi:hypothetical protein